MNRVTLSVDELIKKYKLGSETKKFIEEAMTHSSYSYDNQLDYDYERLEFLGDAVLEIIVSDLIFSDPTLNQGDLTHFRSKYVEKSCFCFLAQESGLIKYLKVGNSVSSLSRKMMSDCFESFFGAVYVTKGIDFAKDLYLKEFLPLQKKINMQKDNKTQLQELMNSLQKRVEYRHSESGPAHDRDFYAEAIVDGLKYGQGTGKSKQEAEQDAAKSALIKYHG